MPEIRTIKCIAAIFAVLVILSAVSCNTTTIITPNLGVVHSFGKVLDKPLAPGWHVKAPWQTIEPVTMEFTDLVFTGTDTSKDDSTIGSQTKDGIEIDLPIAVTWAINPDTLTLVKSRLPGFYTDREYVIIRSAVRDAVAQFSVSDGSLFDRQALADAIATRIKQQTVAYYATQGYGDNSDKIIRYGLVTLRGVFLPEDVLEANKAVIVAKLTALAQAARTKVPDDRSVADYTKVMQAIAVSKAAEDGKATINIISGDKAPAALIVGPK